eukprot:TCONS_00045236-protein
MIMNNTNRTIMTTITRCYGTVDRFHAFIPESHHLYLYILFPSFGAVSLSLNLMTCYVIIKTNQLRNRSTRLIFFCSLNQIGLSLIGYPSLLLMFVLREEIDENCIVKTILIVTSHVFIFSTIYLF